jgi:sigma-B regulation protein RsbU (phosphoserine phosphatase)
MQHLTLQNSIDQITLLPPYVEKAVKASKLDPVVTESLNLALEEAVTNVIDYAYPEGTVGNVDIDTAVTDTALTFTITDSGKPFDPTARAEVDIQADIEDRPVGGLGIHLVRKIMDEVRYERRGERNVLILTKKY